MCPYCWWTEGFSLISPFPVHLPVIPKSTFKTHFPPLIWALICGPHWVSSSLCKKKKKKQQQNFWQPQQIIPSTEQLPWKRQSSSSTRELYTWMPTSYWALWGTYTCVEGCSGPPGPDDWLLMITASESNILQPDGSLEFPHSQTVPSGRASCIHRPSSLVTTGKKIMPRGW